MRSEIPYPKPIHPRDNTWHYKSEHLCSIRKFLLELPKWPVPFVPVKERTTHSSCVTHPQSLRLEKHRGLLGFSSNTRQSNSLLLYTSETRASSCISSGGLSPPPARGNASLTRWLYPKKENALFCGHLIVFAHWDLPKYHWLLSPIFHVKRNFSHSTKTSIPSKRQLLVNLTKKRGKFVRLLPFSTQGLRCLQLTVLEDSATPKTSMRRSHQRAYTMLPCPPCL